MIDRTTIRGVFFLAPIVVLIVILVKAFGYSKLALLLTFQGFRT